MATEVFMPKVDMVMEEGTFVEWLKAEGDRVEKGEPLFVILTDKANIEIEAPASGILTGVQAKPDDVIPVTQVIAYLLKPGEELPEQGSPSQPPTSIAEAPAASAPEPAIATPPAAPATEVRATPVARRLAAERGVDLQSLSGRGPGGRIHKADVLEADSQPGKASLPAQSATMAHTPLPDARLRAVVRLSGPRKIIADRMAHSAFTAPHISLSLRVDMREATRMRRRVLEVIQQSSGQRLSFTAIIARAVAAVLPRHPYVNASLQDEEIILWDDIHLGIAMSVEDYLIVPMLRQAQTMNLEQMVVALADLTQRGLNKRLTPAEMSGSTFTISNLGMFGIESFTAIINPPEAAILAVGRIVDTLVPIRGKAVVRPMMDLTLCADHRIVDGAGAAKFLADLKATLENPYLLI